MGASFRARANERWRALRLLALASQASVLLGCAQPAGLVGSQEASPGGKPHVLASVLAPTGHLRAALHGGSPSSYVAAEHGTAARGVGFDLAQDLARRLNVPFEPLVFTSNVDAIAAVREGRADFIFTNATPQRAKDMDLTTAVLSVEKGVLAPQGTRLRNVQDLSEGRWRIGAMEGSSTATDLPHQFPAADMRSVASLPDAMARLRDGSLDGLAANKAILYELSAHIPGSVMLTGTWGVERYAVGIPQGREAARAYMAAFIVDARRDGTIQRAVVRAGLKGVVPGTPE